MRRMARLENREASTAASGREQVRKSCVKNGWHPRQRRLHMQVRVQFRAKGTTGQWRTAQSENISSSGLLFAVKGELPVVDSDIDLVFLMPAEICGTSAAEVLCQARVVRLTPGSRHQLARVAAFISDYVYLPKANAG